MTVRGRYSVPSLYYYITPLFILLDYAGGLSIRVAVLDSMPLYKNLYYGFCILCGVGVYALPRLTPVVALFESSINVLMMVLAVFLPYIRFIAETDDFLSVDLPMARFDAPHVINIILAGVIAIFGFHGSLRAMGVSGGHRDSLSDQSLMMKKQ
jgi:hypothetical protein